MQILKKRRKSSFSGMLYDENPGDPGHFTRFSHFSKLVQYSAELYVKPFNKMYLLAVAVQTIKMGQTANQRLVLIYIFPEPRD